MLTSNQLTCFIINSPSTALYLSNRESKRIEKKKLNKEIAYLKIVHLVTVMMKYFEVYMMSPTFNVLASNDFTKTTIW